MSVKRSIPFGKPLVGEEEKARIAKVLEGGVYVHGQEVKEFEKLFAEFTEAPCAVAMSNCTVALHLAYHALGIGPGDEVIVSALTHVATAHAVVHTGARPVFVDAEPLTGNIDLDLLENVITERTKAIAVVHFLGMPVDMPRLMTIARKRGLAVVEDCALAIGAKIDGKHAGLWGDFGCFSFYPVKHFTTAEGGMLIFNNRDIEDKIRKLHAFGVTRSYQDRALPGDYDVVEFGYNYRMNEFEAALGVEQMKKLPWFLEKRHENYRRLTEKLRDVSEISLFQSSHDSFESAYYCHCVMLKESLADKRGELLNELKEQGVGCSIYYPRPVPLMSCYREKYGFDETDYPEARAISQRSVALPVGPHVNEDDIDWIASKVKEVIKKVCR